AISSPPTRPLAADARRALCRMNALPPDDVLPLALFARAGDRELDDARAALGRLETAARAGRWGEAVTVLRATPPHLQASSPAPRCAGGLRAEGRGEEERAPLLFLAALASVAAGEAGGPLPLASALRAADADAGAGTRAAALEQAAARVGGAAGAGSDS